jgi:hypothetical protein
MGTNHTPLNKKNFFKINLINKYINLLLNIKCLYLLKKA